MLTFRQRVLIHLLLLSVLVTFLNALKPLQVDDAAYYYVARQISRHPLDPYGFQTFWYQYPEPANNVLAPPVVPYWWAAGIWLFGDRPFFWKLWLWPFEWLFVYSFYRLARRFARGLELPLVWATALSPPFLTGFNLMLDVPALGLGWFALSQFLVSCDRLQPLRALAAGLVAGLAMQTKYTAFLAPGAMGLYGLVAGLLTPRLPLSVRLAKCLWSGLPGFAALNVFVWWEAYTAGLYGQSHFLREVLDSDRRLLDQVRMYFFPLLTLLGGAMPGLILLEMTALKQSRAAVAGSGGVLAFGFVAVAVLGGHWKVPQLLFTGFGVALAVLVYPVVRNLVGRRRGRGRREVWFLLLWLGLEVAGYFVMTPFAAARRVMGVAVVLTLLAGRLATRNAARGKLLPWFLGFQVPLGALFFSVDLNDGWTVKKAVEEAAAVAQPGEKETVWYVGHWGFQFYAERAGMRPVVPDDKWRPLRRGDWLVVPRPPINQQEIHVDPSAVESRAKLTFDDWLPLRTMPCFYGTSSGVPLEHRRGPRVRVLVFRVVSEFVPTSK